MAGNLGMGPHMSLGGRFKRNRGMPHTEGVSSDHGAPQTDDAPRRRYEVELLVVVDPTVYQHRLAFHNGDRKAALAHIKFEFSGALRRIDYVYHQQFYRYADIRIVPWALEIYTNATQIPNKETFESGQFDAFSFLDSLKRKYYLQSGQADHVMWVTYDAGPSGLHGRVKGLTTRGGVCDSGVPWPYHEEDIEAKGVSLIMHRPDLDADLLLHRMLHELGHNLGASKDAVSTSCSVMAENFNLEDCTHRSKVTQYFQFTNTSVQQILDKLKGRTCLLETACDKAVKLDYGWWLPGKGRSYDDTCRFMFGPESHVCKDSLDIGNGCQFSCKDPDNEFCTYVNAWDGQSCNKASALKFEHCVNNKCVWKGKDPAFSNDVNKGTKCSTVGRPVEN